jgi:hypothetical protein
VSRHRFAIEKGLVCVVGWDCPLSSYFAMVRGPEQDAAREEQLASFRGYGYGANPGQDIFELEDLIGPLKAAEIEIPVAIIEALKADRRPDAFATVRPGADFIAEIKRAFGDS